MRTRTPLTLPALAAVAALALAACGAVMTGDVGDTWKENLLLAAEALGETDRAEPLLAGYEARAAEVAERATGGDPGSVEVSVVRSLPGQRTPTSPP